MSITNRKVCPVCGKELAKEFWIDNRDVIYVACDTCSTYAMSMVFYEDYLQNSFTRTQIANFLQNYLNSRKRPFFAEIPNWIPEGYQFCAFWRSNGNADESR